MTKTVTRRLSLSFEETVTEHHSSPLRAVPSVDPEMTPPPRRHESGEYPSLAKCGSALPLPAKRRRTVQS